MNDVETRIAAPTLQPFIALNQITCPSCDRAINWWDRVLCLLKGSTVCVANLRYCAGGKEPTEEAGLGTILSTGRSEIVHACAGITEPHIHVSCRGCGYSWLTRTKRLS